MKYEPRLDAVRAIAIFSVLIEHFVWFIGNKFRAGFFGVNLFFVLSGFLITGILISKTNESFGKSYKFFIGRRVLRIFPIYYLLLIILYILNVQNIKIDFPYLATYIYNYRLGISNSWENTAYVPFWSLAVEEQFYLIFPLIALSFRKSLKLFTVIVATIIFLSFLQIRFNVFRLNFTYVGLIENMGALCTGALGAVLIKRNLINTKYFNSALVELFMICALIVSLIYLPFRWLQIISPIICLYFILKCALPSKFKINFFNRFLSCKAVIRIGKISYGMYLYHMFVSYMLADLFVQFWHTLPFPNHGVLHKLYFNDWIIRFPFLTVCTIIVATLSFRFIEKPILALKDRYFK